MYPLQHNNIRTTQSQSNSSDLAGKKNNVFDLSPGEHQVELSVSVNGQYFHDQIKFTILPLRYQTLVAKLLAVLFLFALLIGGAVIGAGAIILIVGIPVMLSGKQYNLKKKYDIEAIGITNYSKKISKAVLFQLE